MVMKKSVQPVIFYFPPKQNKTHHSWISVTICSVISRWLCHLMNVEMLEHSPFCREHSESITSLPHSRCSINDVGSSTRFTSTYPQPIADRFHRSLIQLPEEMTFVFVPCSCQHPQWISLASLHFRTPSIPNFSSPRNCSSTLIAFLLLHLNLPFHFLLPQNLARGWLPKL